MFRKLSSLMFLVLGLALAGAAVAAQPTVVVAVGTDSAGRSGCWTVDTTYRRYVLVQKRPYSAFRFLAFSQAVTCPPDTYSADACLAST